MAKSPERERSETKPSRQNKAGKTAKSARNRCEVASAGAGRFVKIRGCVVPSGLRHIRAALRKGIQSAWSMRQRYRHRFSATHFDCEVF
jgi:hypothetical protein